jgi:hypothetical protein
MLVVRKVKRERCSKLPRSLVSFCAIKGLADLAEESALYLMWQLKDVFVFIQNRRSCKVTLS